MLSATSKPAKPRNAKPTAEAENTNFFGGLRLSVTDDAFVEDGWVVTDSSWCPPSDEVNRRPFSGRPCSMTVM